MVRPGTICRLGTALVVGLLLAGCQDFKKPSAKNFTSALNFYFSKTDECLFPSAIRFPYEASTASGEVDSHKKALDALANAGLLRSLEDRDIHVKRYELTTYGQRIPPRFCYGHRVVTSIDSSTPPTPVNGQPTSVVSYHYKMMDVPGWADSDEIRKVFPEFAKATSGDAEAKQTLVLTQYGWRYPE
jgi:hypothetical protein